MSNKIKILHLEDEQSDALLISHSLKKRKLESEIVVADSKENFLLALDKFDPDIILADHSLPSFNSFEALELLEELNKPIPVILVTATMTDEFAVDIIKKGAKDYILKDRLERLPSAIENVLRTHRLELERQDFLRQLERSERKFRRLVENSADAVAILSAKGIPLYVSPSVKNVLGYSDKESLLLDVAESIHKDHRQFFFQKMEECKENPEKPFYGILVKVKHQNGDWRWFESTLTNLLHDPDIEGIVVDFRDVTEKQNHLERLKEKTEKLSNVERLAKIGYWEVGLRETYFFWSDEVYRIWGRKKKEFLVDPGTFEKTIHPEDLERFRENQERTINGIQKLDNEYRIILPNGEVKWIQEKGKVIRDEKGSPLRFEGSVQDITERKNFLEKLTQSEARQRAILQSQTNYLTRINLEGYYTYCNEKFLKDFAWIYPNEQVVGEYAAATLHEYHRETAEEVFNNLITNPNTLQQVELDKLQIDGTVKSTLWDFICLTDSKGEPLEIQGVGIDITERVKVEKALKESNLRYELVSKATSDAIYDWDFKTGLVIWSEGYTKNFGYSPNALTSDIESWCANIHSEDKLVLKDLSSAIKGESDTWEAEYRYKRADAKYSFVTEKGTILRDNQGIAIRMVGAIQDITDRKLALQKLMRSESRNRGLIQSQTNYMIRVDAKGRYAYSNNKFEEDFGWIYPDKKIIGKNAMTSIKEYHHQRVADVSQKCIENPDRVFQVEIDKPAKDGKVKTTLWDFIFLKTSSDDPGEIQCVGVDITDRVQAEKEIRFQANLLDKIGQAVIATDRGGIINYWNKAATIIYGWQPEEMIGKSIMDYAPSGTLTVPPLEIIGSLKCEETWSGEALVKRKGGTEFPALITGAPICDEQKNLKGFIAVSSDNSERKKADLKLRELNKSLRDYTRELVVANKGLEQFSFIVSHNLRAPVANIIGLGDLLKEESYPAEVKEKFQKELLDNVMRLDDVVKDLNTILQIKVELNAKNSPVLLEKLVATIEGGISNMVQQNGVQITTNFDKAQEIETVQSYLHSIFYNLILNSIKYRHPERQPKLHIESQRRDKKIILTFRDNGLGFNMDKKKNHIFGLYKRFHPHIEGKGMGLFMVKTQVELLGGNISVSSEVNQGSEFTIELKENLTKDLNNGKTAAIYSS